MRYLHGAAIAAAIGGTLAGASGNVTIQSSDRWASVEFYNSQTGSSIVHSTSTTQTAGAWTGSMFPYAWHHSVVTESFISASLAGRWFTYPLDPPYYEQEIGFAGLTTRFVLSDASTDVVMDNGLIAASLSRLSPDPQSWQFDFMHRTLIEHLPPGTYVFRADCIPDGGGTGTLYIPGAGSYLLLAFGLVPLLARPRRGTALAN